MRNSPERLVPRTVTYTYLAYFAGAIALLLVALIFYAA
jgi:hypothetical protein